MSIRRSSGFAIAADAPLPVEALRELRRCLNRAYGVTHDPAVSTLATAASTLLVEANRHPARLQDLAEALRLAVEAAGLQLGPEVDAAARGIRETLGVAGATRRS